jgi:O-antigen/teichoic acid export membrane protein
MKTLHIGLQGLGLLARKGLLALSFLVAARMLGPKTYGELSYLYTWTYIFFMLSGLGFAAVSTREIARSIPDAHHLLRASLIVRIVSACAGSVLLCVLVATPSLFGRAASLRVALIYAWIIPAYAILDQLGAYVMAFQKNASFAALNLIQWGCFFLATVVALLRGPELAALVAWQTAGMWVGLVLACMLLRRPLLEAWRAKTNHRVAWFLFKEAVPLALTNILAILYFRVGTLYLFRYSGAEQTGIFTSASQIVEASQLIPMALVGAAFPIICRAAQDPEKLASMFEQVTSTLIFIALFVAATGTVVSSTVVRLLYGASYVSSGFLLRVLIWTVVPTFLHYALAYFLIAVGRQQVVPISALVGVAVSLTCNFLLVPRLGALGAVYSSAATETSICVLHLFFVVKYVVLRRQIRFVSIAAVGALVVWILGELWEGQINATMSHVFSFGVLSMALFSISFLAYRRLASRVEIA